MWTCPFCHTDVPNGATICTGCHAEVDYQQFKTKFILTIGLIVVGYILGQSLNPTLGIICSIIGGIGGIIASFKFFKNPVFRRMNKFNT